MGVAAVVDRWEVGFGVNGIANRMNWTGVERTTTFSTASFWRRVRRSSHDPTDDARVELPVDIRANGAYNADAWTGIAEYGHGYNGTTLRAGYEHRFNRLQLRGGGRYIKERWEPTGGVGFNLSQGFGVDVAAFGTSANLERKRHVAIAVSLWFMHRNP